MTHTSTPHTHRAKSQRLATLGADTPRADDSASLRSDPTEEPSTCQPTNTDPTPTPTREDARTLRVLHLSLKEKWFRTIESGEKSEEYRLIKDYWTNRLAKDYDAAEFTLGYPKRDDTSRRMTFEIKSIDIAYGRPEWGAIPGLLLYVIRLGKRLDRGENKEETLPNTPFI